MLYGYVVEVEVHAVDKSVVCNRTYPCMKIDLKIHLFPE